MVVVFGKGGEGCYTPSISKIGVILLLCDAYNFDCWSAESTQRLSKQIERE